MCHQHEQKLLANVQMWRGIILCRDKLLFYLSFFLLLKKKKKKKKKKTITHMWYNRGVVNLNVNIKKKRKEKTRSQLIQLNTNSMRKFNHPLQFSIFCILAIVLLYWQLGVSFSIFFDLKQHLLLLSKEIIFLFFWYFLITSMRLSKLSLFFLCDLKTWNLKISKRWLITILSLLL